MRGRATTGYYRKWEFLDVRCMTSTYDRSARHIVSVFH